MAQSQTAANDDVQTAKYNGVTVEILDSESHRSKDMYKVRAPSGDVEWVFGEELENAPKV